MAKQCRAPGCGRFVRVSAERCDHHPDVSSPDDGLTGVIDALQHALDRLRQEEDIEIIGRYVPRVSSALVQAMRARHQIGGAAKGEYLTLLNPVLEDLERLRSDRLQGLR